MRCPQITLALALTLYLLPESVVGTIWLPSIERFHSKSEDIEFSFNNDNYAEYCYLITPQNETIRQDDSEGKEGIIFQKSSYFVSCRVTAGPVDESFEGNWILCGSYYGDKRCRSHHINVIEDGDDVTFEPSPHVAVRLTDYVTLSVSDEDDGETMLNCFVITPLGEKLILSPDTTYPRIEYQADHENMYCTVTIGPFNTVADELLGNWNVYGTTEDGDIIRVHREYSIYLYDVEHPYAQPYNVTTNELKDNVIYLGTNITLQSCVDGIVLDCLYKPPNGELSNNTVKYNDNLVVSQHTNCENGQKGCHILVKTTHENMLGDWKLVTKSRNGEYFNELRQPLRIRKLDPANPAIYQYTDFEVVNSKTEDVEILTKSSNLYIETNNRHTQKCFIRTPSGLQYELMEGFDVKGVKINKDFFCSVTLIPTSADYVGNWTLIYRQSYYTSDGEVRWEKHFYYYMNVVVYVKPFPERIVISPGNDFHLRFENPFENSFDSCKLQGPITSETYDVTKDVSYTSRCAFVVRNTSKDLAGTWTLEHKDNLTSRARVVVEVVGEEGIFQNTQEEIWSKYKPKNEIFEPANLSYCRIQDYKGSRLFEDFGICKITIDQVVDEHNGILNLELGYQGNIVSKKLDLSIKVEGRPKVATAFFFEHRALFVSCAISSLRPGTACRFHSPAGNVLLATPGLGQGRYQYYGEGNKMSGGTYNYSCGIQVDDPTHKDEGSWKCALQIENITHFGFLEVTKQNEISEKTLKADRNIIKAVQGGDGILSCSINSALSYCYFTSPEGVMHTVDSDDRDLSAAYVGHGLAAGECGLRLRRVSARDAGEWACHAGAVGEHDDYTAYLHLEVKEALDVQQYRNGSTLIILAQAYDARKLEYCRFVRADGVGFLIEKVPAKYTSSGSALEKGLCVVRIPEPTATELRPWTVVAKIESTGQVVTRLTSDDLPLIAPQSDAPQSYDKMFLILFSWNIILSMAVLLLLGEKLISRLDLGKPVIEDVILSKKYHINNKI